MITWGWNNKARDFDRKLWCLHNSHKPLIIFIFTNWTVWQNKSQPEGFTTAETGSETFLLLWLSPWKRSLIPALTWNSGPMSTSNPRSAKPVAMTLAPLSWPSWPIFATSRRGFLPSCFLKSAILKKKKKKTHRKQKSGWPEATSSWWTWRRWVWPVVGHGDLLLLPVLAAVRPAHHPGAGFVFPKHGLHGIGDLTYGASGKRRRNPFRPGATTGLLLETWGEKVANKEGDCLTWRGLPPRPGPAGCPPCSGHTPLWLPGTSSPPRDRDSASPTTERPSALFTAAMKHNIILQLRSHDSTGTFQI